jgi:hypothetical protein
MTQFTAEDVNQITEGGNANFNAKYLARAGTARDYNPNVGSDVAKLRDFIRTKYVDKRWYSEDVTDSAVDESSSRINIRLNEKVSV